ncbi:MAG: sterol desaturase family protein [bacterium]
MKEVKQFIFFVSILLSMAVLEIIAPRRSLPGNKIRRWRDNLGIVLVNSYLVRLIIPVMPTAMAVIVDQHKIGLLNTIFLLYWLSLLISIIILDFIIYLQHVMFHIVPLLWLFHMVHHADIAIDATTGLRFHPIEIICSMGIKLMAIYLLGPPALAVLIFEIILNGLAMFNHSNIYIPLLLDALIRLFIVTPDMHRVHHSVMIHEMNSNFGFNIALWDRIFGTYTAQPQSGHTHMTLGMAPYRDIRKQHMLWMLALPFIGKKGGNINVLRHKRKSASD